MGEYCLHRISDVEKGSEVNESSDFIEVIWQTELEPINLFVTLHIVEMDAGWLRIAIDKFQCYFLAEQMRTLARQCRIRHSVLQITAVGNFRK